MIPRLETRAICITNDRVIGAAISSYFNTPESYFAIFKFPDVKPHADSPESMSDEYVSNIIGGETATLINNAIARLRPEKVILAGLTEAQKTFFEFIPQSRRVDITNSDEIEAKLAYLERQFRGRLMCSPDNLVIGLLQAKREGMMLVITDDTAERFEVKSNTGTGIIVIENKRDISSIIAVNYAFSVNASIALVPQISRSTIHWVQDKIRNWKEQGDAKARTELEEQLTNQVGKINFDQYAFATFFTDGLPYSLVLENKLLVTHVMLSVKEDLFVFNNILYEYLDSFEAAIVFSPEEFEEEETDDVIKELRNNGFMIVKLVGRAATVRNFNHYAQQYPYDLLHICSHGGETNGYRVVDRFRDRAGNEHEVEYDEVVGFEPSYDTKMVRVNRKLIFRRFDDCGWMTPELSAKNLPKYIFEDMRKVLFDGSAGKNASSRKQVKEPIASSCHIKCYDSIHQGMFWAVASHGSPVIFNNTCSSWYEISLFFLSVGCRGYIGTLWSINNAIAKQAAERFYRILFGGSIAQAYFEMINSIRETSNADIYIFWGLHFSTMKKPSGNGKVKVARELLRAALDWCEKIVTTRVQEVKENSADILKFIISELKGNLGQADIAKIERIIENNPEIKEALVKKERTPKWFERGVIKLP